jgi:hypothetical protein
MTRSAKASRSNPMLERFTVTVEREAFRRALQSDAGALHGDGGARSLQASGTDREKTL